MSAKDFGLEDFNNGLREDKAMLIEYWAPWCKYCRRIVGAYDVIAKEREDLIVAKINIDDEKELAKREKIEVVPTLILYKDGKAKGSVVAPDSKAAIDSFINSTL